MPVAHADTPGLRELAGCRLDEELYVGSAVHVYRGVRLRDSHPVVVKAVRAEALNPAKRIELRYEYEIGEFLHTQGVVGVAHPLDLWERDGQCAIVFADTGGYALRHWQSRRALTPRAALQVARQIAAILGQIHQHGVIHKDVNPSNIIYNSSTHTTQLIDFGLSIRLAREVQNVDVAGRLEGTLAYMPPEQTGRTSQPVDYRSDYYSLGASLYEMLTGHVPFTEDDMMLLIHAVLTRQPPTLPATELVQNVAAVVDKLLRKAPDQRYQSSFGLCHDLDLCLADRSDFIIGAADRCERFEIPQKLYGRSQAVAQVLSEFQTAAAGAQRFLFLAGDAGGGKSALLQALQPALLTHGALMASGKFEQFRRNVPLSAVTQAMGQLVRQILRDKTTDPLLWRARIESAVDNVQVLLNVMPDLQLLLGPAQPLNPVPPEEQQQRLLVALRQLFEALPTLQPLVILLDDLQWSDDGTLRLLHALAKSQAQRLLIIGAYRSNEVGPEHPLHALTDVLRVSNRFSTLTLAPLQAHDIAELLTDATQATVSLQPLAELVCQKTAGNPFFVQAFIRHLWEQHLLRYDIVAGTWHWDLAAIAAAHVTDNVVALMQQAMAALPAATCTLLGAAACIGNRFALASLAQITEQRPADAARDLWPALEAGIIVAMGRDYRFAHDAAGATDATYQFAHDRVQQAAHENLAADEARRWHYRIARDLLRDRDVMQAETWVFDVIDHVNQARDSFTSVSERQELIRLNLTAGACAQGSGAFNDAYTFFTIAAAALGPAAWPNQMDWVTEAELGLADCEMLTQQVQRGQARLRALLERMEPLPMRARVVQRLYWSLASHDEVREAERLALRELRRYKLFIAERSNLLHLVRVLIKVDKRIKLQPLSGAGQLPHMRDENGLALTQLLACLASSSLSNDGTLFSICVLWLAYFTLDMGLSRSSAVGMTMYAMLTLIRKEDVHSAEQANAAVDAILTQFPNSNMVGTIHTMRTAMVAHFSKTLPEVAEQCFAGWHQTVQLGDVFYAGLVGCIGISLQSFFAPEQALNRAKHQAAYSLGRLTESGALGAVTAQFALALLGQTDDATSLQSPGYNEAEEHAHVAANKNPYALNTYSTSKLQLHYLFGSYAQACGYAKAVATPGYFRDYKLNVAFVLFAMPYLLSRIGVARAAGQQRVRDRLFSHVLRQLHRFARLSPKNYAGCISLVRAEMADLRGDESAANVAYESAVGQLVASGNLFFVSSAQEMAGRAYARRNLLVPAIAYLRDALTTYRTWGVPRKVAHVEQFLRSLTPALVLEETRHSVDTLRTGSTRRDLASTLEMPSLMRATQAISQEVVQAKLVETLMRNVMQSAGADRGLLLFVEGGQWSLAAYTDSTPTRLDAPAAPSDMAQFYATSLVEFVARSREAIVLQDARKDALLRDDPYMQAAQPFSLLCAPIINKSEFKGVIYLENHATAGAFTTGHLQMTALLAAQAAISLENAQVYAHLEDKVRERTLALEQAMEQVAALSRTDSLTQIPNRRHFTEVLHLEMQRVSRQPAPFTLVMIDIDFFKKVNDTYGHQGGDAILQAVAKRLSTTLREIDVVGRLGGEEFGVLLPNCDVDGAGRTCERLRAAVEALRVPVHGHGDVCVTISLGAACVPERVEADSEALYRQADAALYEAKHGGRNRAMLHLYGQV